MKGIQDKFVVPRWSRRRRKGKGCGEREAVIDAQERDRCKHVLELIESVGGGTSVSSSLYLYFQDRREGGLTG